MKISLYSFLLLICNACTGPNQPKVAQPESKPVDTIRKLPCDYPEWRTDDTLFRSAESSFFYSHIPHLGFSQKIKLQQGFLGIIAQSWADAQALALYQTDTSGHWTQVYCGPLDGGMSYETKMPDLNFDGYPDLLIDGDYGGIYGNHFSVGFLYDSQQKVFRHYDALDFENLAIDLKNNQLRGEHYGSYYGTHIKRLHGWEGDSLVLLKEAVYHADYKTAIIWIKERQKGGALKQDSIQGESDRLWGIFKKRLLWKGFGPKD
ncbi:MAG: hypothetical protein KA165_09635 [Saprospiraceae bacterium]|nr:hypothetical protein [Saprospiraceae bacterium]